MVVEGKESSPLAVNQGKASASLVDHPTLWPGKKPK